MCAIVLPPFLRLLRSGFLMARRSLPSRYQLCCLPVAVGGAQPTPIGRDSRFTVATVAFSRQGTTVGRCPNISGRRAGRLAFLPTTALAPDRPNDVSGATAGVLLQTFTFARLSPCIVESQTGGRRTHAEVPIYLRPEQLLARTMEDPFAVGTNGWPRPFHETQMIGPLRFHGLRPCVAIG